MAWGGMERAALVESFRRADPEGPTLCTGWNTRRLLAHLVQREHTPLLRAADALRRPQPGTERHLSVICGRAESPAGYEALLQRFAGGTSWANPFTWLGDAAQVVEYTIHHEDLRRGGTGAAEPRDLPEGQLKALWSAVPFLARRAFRKSPVGVVLVVPGGGRLAAHRGEDTVVVTGPVVELVLASSGRRRAALVDVDGTEAAVARFEGWLGGSPGRL
ncbi:TIGR03085 family metal-binding protein [Arthrobacter sp. 35W]|uniref:TIGR03085 family metal-binding protein n=1 Tax=Arthrobacter sp. 35W TaxID=1132441 RepID=UPI0009DF7AA0|nr:TIGR03085 family metal-binding protein [Arthrobacter sp. 35W]